MTIKIKTVVMTITSLIIAELRERECENTPREMERERGKERPEPNAVPTAHYADATKRPK